jgi:hypothetical protein
MQTLLTNDQGKSFEYGIVPLGFEVNNHMGELWQVKLDSIKDVTRISVLNIEHEIKWKRRVEEIKKVGKTQDDKLTHSVPWKQDTRFDKPQTTNNNNITQQHSITTLVSLTLATNRVINLTTCGSSRNCQMSMTTFSMGTLSPLSCPRTSSINLLRSNVIEGNKNNNSKVSQSFIHSFIGSTSRATQQQM